MMGDDPQDSGTLFDVERRAPSWKGVQGTSAPPVPAASSSALFDAGLEASRNDRTDFQSRMLTDGYAPILDALGPTVIGHQQYGSRRYAVHLLNPGNLSDMSAPSQYGTIASRGAMEESVAASIRARRLRDPKFLPGVPDTVAGLRTFFAKQEAERRAKANATLQRGQGLSGWAAGFAGQAAGGLTDPLNLVTLPLGGGGTSVARIVLSEALVNGGVELLSQPVIAQNRELVGEHLSLGEAAGNVGMAAVAGGAFGGGLHLGGKAIGAAANGAGAARDRVSEALFNALPAPLQRKWADAMTLHIEGADGAPGEVRLIDLLSGLDHKTLVASAEAMIGRERMTPDELAATHVLEREASIGERSPFVAGPAGDAEHGDQLAASLQALIDDAPPPEEIPIPRGDPEATAPLLVSRGTARGEAPPLVIGEGAAGQFMAKVRRAESGGHDGAANPNSSAQGRYQFTDGTWLTYYKRRFGAGGASDAQILAKKGDGALQDQLMADLTADNRELLRRAGQAETAGNLYLLHFLGPRALGLLKAEPDRAVASLLPADFITRNRSVLAGKSASEVIAWAHRKMGGAAAAVPPRAAGSLLASAGDDALVAQLRSAALAEGDAAVGGVLGETDIPGVGRVPLYAARLRPSDYGVDAERFQFKSGGDDAGVLDTLKGVRQWDPARSGRVLYWQDKAGAYWVADGHQRTGLAKRLEAQGHEVHVDGMVIREADGVTADQARSYGALLNILNKSADPVDAAKVLRGLGFATDLGLPPNSAHVRNANGLARLSDGAFGAVVNGHLAPDMGAMIGRLLPDDPDAHGAMAELLIKLDPANTAQAESIIRQALAAGMHREEQIGLFGAEAHTSSLFLPRAKVLEKGLARLRGAKLAYSTAAREADTLERAGSTIARDASMKEAQANAEAIDVIRRVAYSQGPVSDALNAAAAKLAAGGKLGDVVGEFVDAVRGIDLNAVARGSDGLPAGRGEDGGNFGDDQFGEPGGDLFAQRADPGQPPLAELEAATARFSDPDGAAVRQQAASVEHDFKTHLMGSVAAVAEPPPARAVPTDTALPAEDLVDLLPPGEFAGLTFRLGEEGDEIHGADLLAEIDADDAAIKAMKDCL